MSNMDYGDVSEMQDQYYEESSNMFPPGTTEEEIAALYNNPALYERYLQELQLHYSEIQQNYSVYDECAVPVVTQSFHQMWQLLFYCLILRCLWKLRMNCSFVHFITVVFGFMSMWKFYNRQMLHAVLPTLVFLPYFQLKRFYKGSVVCLVTTVYLIACEFWLLDAVEWNKVKGTVMIVMMKAISVIFDIENGVTEVPTNLLEFSSYVFHPASVIFGPFLTYKNYTQIFQAHSFDLLWWLHSIRSIFLSVVCLLWSSCGTTNYLPKLSTYIPILEEDKWWTAYSEAQSFRFSHYFICFFSEACCLVSGIGTICKPKEVNAKKEESGVKKSSNAKEECEDRVVVEKDASVLWSFPVAYILPVELPGSLVDVVTNWNLPMHYWLKNYVYKTTRVHGVFIAILATYICSSILHGMNFQLSAVLLSIGIFAYVESATRNLLADTFSACIEARPCKEKCTHTYKRTTFWVIAVNLVFSLVAMWNLAYLGCLFDSSTEEEAGYSMAHALKKWQKYGYINHWVMMVVFLFQGFVINGRVI